MIMDFTKIYPRDIIAAIAIIFCFSLLMQGIDSFVAATITLIIGYYFSRREDIHKASK